LQELYLGGKVLSEKNQMKGDFLHFFCLEC
jgi:hypothetical protein